MSETALVLFLNENACGLAVIASVLFTLVHTLDEVVGAGGPLWDYLQEKLAVPGPRWLLVLLVLAVAPLAAVTAAVLGYAGGSPFWLGLLVGLRLGDAANTHIFPAVAGVWPNPGLATTPLYAAEVALVLLLAKDVAPAGVFVGILPFTILVNARSFIRR